MNEVVERFYDAFNEQDLDAFVSTLDPEVELQTARGVRIGHDEARSWATKSPAGDLDQRLVVEELIEDEHRTHVVAMTRKQWRWRESDELAHDEAVAALFTFRDGLVARWQPFADREEALRAAGIEAGGGAQ